MPETLLEDIIDDARDALAFIEDQLDELLNILPDELADTGTQGNKYLSRIYEAISDERAMLRAAYAMAAHDIQDQLGYAAASKAHIEQLRAEARKDAN